MQTGQSLASSRWAARHCPWPPVTARSPAVLRASCCSVLRQRPCPDQADLRAARGGACLERGGRASSLLAAVAPA